MNTRRALLTLLLRCARAREKERDALSTIEPTNRAAPPHATRARARYDESWGPY
jgi:hypothetical protein